MADFIPRSNSELLSWARNASQKLCDDPLRYGISPQAAQEFADRFADFAQARAISTTPSTRTSISIKASDSARSAMIEAARNALGIVRAQGDFSEQKKAELGLPAGPGRDGKRRKIGKPTSAPALQVVSVVGSIISLKLSNMDYPSKRGLARDINAAAIFAFAGENPPADVRQWRPLLTTRTNPKLDLGSSYPAGTRVLICAQWLNRRGQCGPEGRIVTANLGAPSMRFAGKIAA